MFPVALAGVVLVLGASKLPVLNLGILRWFGKISYGLYLWNYVLISLEPDGRLLTGRERVLAAGAAIGFAAASWYLIESPILRLKQRFQRVPDVLSPPIGDGPPTALRSTDLSADLS
jgi:peptidoglycan/LPS O-acetylase OafA/YrhL